MAAQRFEAAVNAAASSDGNCWRGEQPVNVGDAAERLIAAERGDVLEDTDYFPVGLGPRQESALRAVTRWPQETHATYIDRLCTYSEFRDINEIGMYVKLADLWHNLQPERQACLPEKERKGLEKRYLKAREQIWEALGHRWWPEPLEGEG